MGSVLQQGLKHTKIKQLHMSCQKVAAFQSFRLYFVTFLEIKGKKCYTKHKSLPIFLYFASKQLEFLIIFKCCVHQYIFFTDF